jgi:glycosyltransferase involved in cell wall biosynthesis
MLGVSVVIPCFNAGAFLRDAIRSILAQDFDGQVEVLIGEDASTDNSRDIAESFGAPVRVLCDPAGRNLGMSAVRNRCIAAATYPLIAFLDADDYWLPGHLSSLTDVINQRPELGLVYDDGYDVNINGDLLCTRVTPPSDDDARPDDMLVQQSFPPAAVVVRRQVFDRVGMFEETLRNCADHDMWLRIVESFPACHVKTYGFCYRTHSEQNSLSPRLWTAAERVLSRAIHRYPYQRRTIRKRRAVIAFRHSQIARDNHQYVRTGLQLVKAAALDPARAAGEFWRHSRRLIDNRQLRDAR